MTKSFSLKNGLSGCFASVKVCHGCFEVDEFDVMQQNSKGSTPIYSEWLRVLPNFVSPHCDEDVH